MIVAILAGGEGTRLKEITKNKPKVLAKVKGKDPFLKIQLDYFSKYSEIKAIYLLTKKFESQVKRFVDVIQEKYKFKISIISDGKRKLGTGGAIKKFSNNIRKDFILIYGDTFPTFNLRYLIKRRYNKKNYMVIFKNNNLYDLSNIKINKNMIVDYNKDKSMKLIYSYIDYGIMLFRYQELSKINKFIKYVNFDLSIYLKRLIEEKKLYYLLTEKRFYEIGKREALKKFINYYNNSNSK